MTSHGSGIRRVRGIARSAKRRTARARRLSTAYGGKIHPQLKSGCSTGIIRDDTTQNIPALHNTAGHNGQRNRTLLFQALVGSSAVVKRDILRQHPPGMPLPQQHQECLDKLLIFNEAHLRRVLREYVDYYNTARPHQGLAQQTPIPRIISIAGGPVRCRDVLGGIQHDCYRDTA